jgi:A/G-specific adenine glycosylase
VQRPNKGLLAGMWEFPLFPMSVEDNQEGYLRKCLMERGILSGKSGSVEYVGEITHVFSHVHHTYSVYCVTVRDEVDGAPGLDACTHRWVPTSDLQQCALSTAMRKVYKQVQSKSQRKRRHDRVGESAKKGKQKKLDSFWSSTRDTCTQLH